MIIRKAGNDSSSNYRSAAPAEFCAEGIAGPAGRANDLLRTRGLHLHWLLNRNAAPPAELRAHRIDRAAPLAFVRGGVTKHRLPAIRICARLWLLLDGLLWLLLLVRRSVRDGLKDSAAAAPAEFDAGREPRTALDTHHDARNAARWSTPDTALRAAARRRKLAARCAGA